MFFVAGGALEITRRVMIPGPRLNPRADFRVTVQALIAECLLSEVVTLRAILYPVKFHVHARELAGRDELRKIISTEKNYRCEKEKCSEDNWSHEKI